MPFRQLRPGSRRAGAAAVEFAIVALPLFMFLLTGIEFGRALMCLNTMQEAARAGSRESVLQGSTVATIEQEVATVMSLVNIDGYEVRVEPENYQALPAHSPISVTVQASFSQMSWLPAPRRLAGANFSASCTLPKESEPAD